MQAATSKPVKSLTLRQDLLVPSRWGAQPAEQRRSMNTSYDAIVIGTGQAGPFLAQRLTAARLWSQVRLRPARFVARPISGRSRSGTSDARHRRIGQLDEPSTSPRCFGIAFE